MADTTEQVDIKVPTGETVTAIVPRGASDADVRSLLQQKHPEYFPQMPPPSGPETQGVLTRGVGGALTREGQYLKGQAQAYTTNPPFSPEQGKSAEQIQQEPGNQGLLKNIQSMQERGMLPSMPDWAVNLIHGRQIPESIGAMVTDLGNLAQSVRGGMTAGEAPAAAAGGGGGGGAGLTWSDFAKVGKAALQPRKTLIDWLDAQSKGTPAAQQTAVQSQAAAQPVVQQTQSAAATVQQAAQPVAQAAANDAVDLAKALGYKNVTAAQTAMDAKGGPGTWAKAVQGKPVVAAAVDAKVPAGPINDAATNVAATSAAQGDVAHIDAVIDAATKLTDELPAKEAANPKLNWEDILDERAWQEKMRNAQQEQEQSYWTYKGRLNRAAASADTLKGYLTSPEQAVASMPAPGGTMEANKLLGYQNRPTVAQATAIRNQALTGTPARPTVPLKDFLRMRYGTGTELKPAP